MRIGDLGEAQAAGLLSLGCQGPGSEPRGLLIPYLTLASMPGGEKLLHSTIYRLKAAL